MEMRKCLSVFLVLGFLTCNMSLATPNYTWQPSGPATFPVQQTVTYQQTTYYPNDNYYYVQPYQQPQEVVYQEQVVQQESFADKHPIVTGLGVALLFAGAITGAVLLSDDEPRHRHKPHHRG